MPEIDRRLLYKVVADFLVEARHSKNLNQAELAQRMGRRQPFVSNYERNERRLDLAEFIEIAQTLELDPVEALAAVIAECRRGV